MADTGEEDPTLTEDEREIFFSVSSELGYDIWTSTREQRGDPWRAPSQVAELSTEHVDGTPEVSANGLTLYFASTRPAPPGVTADASHLWVSTRASRASTWGEPAFVPSPPPGEAELSPSLDVGGAWLAYASSVAGNWDLYLAYRSSPLAPWQAHAPLSTLNTEAADWDPSLFFGATAVVFSSRREDEGNIFEARRESTAEAFSAPVPRSELNTFAAEGDPWVSADGRRIYFFSSRGGSPTIYSASR